MALQVAAPAPYREQTGSILDFLLSMSTLEERKKSRKVSEAMVEVRVGELDIARAKAPSQIEQALSVADYYGATADLMRRETKEQFTETNVRLRQRLAALKTYGTKVDIAELKRELSRSEELFEIWGKKSDEVKFDIAFADQIAKSSQREVRGLQAEIGASRAQLGNAELARKIAVDAVTQDFNRYKLGIGQINKMQSAGARNTATIALDTKDPVMMQEALRAESDFLQKQQDVGEKAKLDLKATGPVTEMQIDPALSADTQISPTTLGQLRAAQISGAAPPETRIIKRPEDVRIRPLEINWLDPLKPIESLGIEKEFMMLTRFDAEQRGLLKEWDAAGPSQEQPTKPTPESPIRKGTREAVKKVTPAKKKPTKEKKPKTDERGWLWYTDPEGNSGWLNPRDLEKAKAAGYTIGK